MSIKVLVAPISDGEELVSYLLNKEFGVNENDATRLYKLIIQSHFNNLKDEMYLVAETSYVDKVYRDSYYNYFSSKLTDYKRDCIRISLFEGKINTPDFENENNRQKLQDQYRGFIILRPTSPHFIGRSIISPKALKNNGFVCCTSTFHTTVNGQKFTIEGFPHSSQDTETISCAETSLWAIMEYFSNRYSNYIPVLPSDIINTLKQVSNERQIPSKGLNIQQMSFALKDYGFGTRIYSKSQYHDEFESIFSCYIESGIPLIVAIQGGNIGHALLAIGRENSTENQIDNLNSKIYQNEIKICDYNSLNTNFVFIDDNQPVYQIASINSPAKHYNSIEWENCKMTYFIAPLYPKIYLEAFEAKNYVISFLTNGPASLDSNSDVLLRFYLTSSRSYKDCIATNSSLQNDIKGIIMESPMPKFIWVAEISSKELIKNNQANGLVILDATEANIYFNKPLILAAYQSKLMIYDKLIGKLEINNLILQSFNIFDNNLKSFQ